MNKGVDDAYSAGHKTKLRRFGREEGFPANGNHQPQEWEKLIDLLQPSLPSFPLEALPLWARHYVEAVSVFTQTPSDLAGMLFLAVLALAVQKRVEAAPKAGWIEQLCLWVFVALASGNVKSGVFRHLVEPVSDYEYQLALSKREEIAAEVQSREIKEARLKHLRDKAAKESDLIKRQELASEAATIAEELAMLQITVAPRFLADDATPEKIAMLMAEHGGRIAIMSPDTDAFAIMGGRYSGDGQADFTVYLKAHSGDDIRVDRVQRAPVVIRRPALTMGLLAQPGVLTRLFEKPEFRDRGLLARFFIIVPTSWVGRRAIDPAPIPIDVPNQYGEQIKRLLRMEAGKDDGRNEVPHRLEFTQAAGSAISEFRASLEPKLGEGGDLEYLADWGSKLGGGLVRIAALLHLAELSDQREPWSTPVDATNVQAAKEIVEYLIAHARAAFRLIGSDPSLDGARKIVRWLKRHEQPRVSRRDIHNGLQWAFKTVEEVDRPLALLVDHHYLRLEEVERAVARGRPASPVFEVNPELLKS